MDRKAIEITKFLLDWNELLTSQPVKGMITEIYFCFILSNYSKGKDRVSWQQFVKYLNQLNMIGDGHVLDCLPEDALKLAYPDPFKCFSRIKYINRLLLALILRKAKLISRGGEEIPTNLQVGSEGVGDPLTKEPVPSDRSGRLDLLLKLVGSTDNATIQQRWETVHDFPQKVIEAPSKLTPADADDIYSLTSRSGRLEQLELLLKTECGSHQLLRDRARRQTEELPFYDCCENQDHANQLAHLTEFDRATNTCHLSKAVNPWVRCSGALVNCLHTKMHYIPYIQPQTDIKLGDCSYLDTCHKMDTCRYVHYGLLMPVEETDTDTKAEASSWDSTQLNLFSRGEPIALYSMREEVPPQWINCDVTKLDFRVLGQNWAVILADPSWTIHMNLNYSSMKDDDLASLGMDQLQTEGVFLLWVTGRTIEMGKEFLTAWGYKVVNQITWVKTSQLVRTISTGRTGHWLNHSKEHLLVGLKGDPQWLNYGVDPQVLISSTRETSRKPDEIYGMVERMVGPRTKKLEFFGRQHNTRPGWLTVGNQLEGTHLVERELIDRYGKYAGADIFTPPQISSQ